MYQWLLWSPCCLSLWNANRPSSYVQTTLLSSPVFNHWRISCSIHEHLMIRMLETCFTNKIIRPLCQLILCCSCHAGYCLAISSSLLHWWAVSFVPFKLPFDEHTLLKNINHRWTCLKNVNVELISQGLWAVHNFCLNLLRYLHAWYLNSTLAHFFLKYSEFCIQQVVRLCTSWNFSMAHFASDKVPSFNNVDDADHWFFTSVQVCSINLIKLSYSGPADVEFTWYEAPDLNIHAPLLLSLWIVSYIIEYHTERWVSSSHPRIAASLRINLI